MVTPLTTLLVRGALPSRNANGKKPTRVRSTRVRLPTRPSPRAHTDTSYLQSTPRPTSTLMMHTFTARRHPHSCLLPPHVRNMSTGGATRTRCARVPRSARRPSSKAPRACRYAHRRLEERAVHLRRVEKAAHRPQVERAARPLQHAVGVCRLWRRGAKSRSTDGVRPRLRHRQRAG